MEPYGNPEDQTQRSWKTQPKDQSGYLLKEAFRRFWDYTYPASAKKYLDKWFWWATHSRLEPMRKFAWMIRRHQNDVLNYFQVLIDNGLVEGLNNKAKVISHRAYGYRSAETFKLALLHGLGKLPEPNLTHRFLWGTKKVNSAFFASCGEEYSDKEPFRGGF